MKFLNKSSPKSAASANKLLSAAQTLELLQGLRTAIRDIAVRVAEHEQEFAVRSAAVRAQFDRASKQQREQTQKRIEQRSACASERRRQIEAAFQSRGATIARALRLSQARRMAEIEVEETGRTREIHQGLVKADNARDAGMVAANRALEAFNARLVTEAVGIEKTEANARGTLGVHRRLAQLLKTPPGTHPDLSGGEQHLLEQCLDRLAKTERALSRCRWMILPVLFRFLPVWLWLLAVLGVPFALVPELRQFNFQEVPAIVWEIIGAGFFGVLALGFISGRLALPAARVAAGALDEARKLYNASVEKVRSTHEREMERVQLAAASQTRELNSDWKQIQAAARTLRDDWAGRLQTQARKLNGKNEDRRHSQLSAIEEESARVIAGLTTGMDRVVGELEKSYAESNAKLLAAWTGQKAKTDHDWRTEVEPALEKLQACRTEARELFAPWSGESWKGFAVPAEFLHAALFGGLAVDLAKLSGVTLAEKGLRLPGENQFVQPLLIRVPDGASILFETKNSGHGQVVGALNNLVLRLLTSAPPGRLRFTIFDPVSLGENFAGIMHLADYEERIINSRIWTQQSHIEERLSELNAHIEKVTQMYLRNEYQSLADYNAQAGRLAEKYHFLMIADFPANFSDVAVKRLQSIVASGPRCGVHTFIHWDQRRTAPVELVPEELRRNSLCLIARGDGFVVPGREFDGTVLTLESPPAPDLMTQLLHQIGRTSLDSYRVEMPFSEAVPTGAEIWSLDTARELRIPIGRTGATKLQYLALGQGTRQHGLIAGKTGSGKSTLFHVIITNLALWCSPDQVEFYLVDFKKGVEFKCYATHKLPHARVVAVESDREFGLSVLQRLDEELKRRGDLFRRLGVQDIGGYRKTPGTGPLPRTLLLIDEFQELFVEDDRVSQGAALLLDRIVRQGRAFGIHVMLGSQTLGGAYSLARATIGQMVVRIALQCNEADALLIMSEDNPAPRLLSRPGEAIYNDDGGAIEGNSPFQIVWLPDQVRDEWLDKIRTTAEQKQRPAEPIVFEGNAPASVRDNVVLRGLLETGADPDAATARIWLGAPNSIKGPTEAVFRRQSGHHLLIVGQREEAALGMLGIAQISLAAAQAKRAAQIYVFTTSAPDSVESRFLERVARVAPQRIKLAGAAGTADVMAGLTAEMDRRAAQPGADGPAHFLIVHDLQRHRKLRFDEELSFSMEAGAGAGQPGQQFNRILCEGASLGFHVIASCDTYANVMRFLSRKAVAEFEMRAVFQMSANDSASLIESPQANLLGLHRAILFNGQQGWMETFRPYALPDDEWLEEAGRRLADRKS